VCCTIISNLQTLTKTKLPYSETSQMLDWRWSLSLLTKGMITCCLIRAITPSCGSYRWVWSSGVMMTSKRRPKSLEKNLPLCQLKISLDVIWNVAGLNFHITVFIMMHNRECSVYILQAWSIHHSVDGVSEHQNCSGNYWQTILTDYTC
jgi:hypothetical protein